MRLIDAERLPDWREQTMRYEYGNVVMSIETIPGLGKKPGLWIGTKSPNVMWKVACFGSKDKADTTCKWLEYMFGVSKDEPQIT